MNLAKKATIAVTVFATLVSTEFFVLVFGIPGVYLYIEIGKFAGPNYRSIQFFKLYGLKQKDLMAAMEKARVQQKALKQKRVTYVARNFAFDNY